MQPGATVEVDRGEAAEGEEPEVTITITQPKRGQKREPVTVGGDGEEAEAGGDEADPSASAGGGESSLPDEPEVLPEAPDAPPSEDEPGPPTES
jgi:hypothetical protein